MPVTFDHDTTGILPAVGDAERLSAEDFRAAAAELGVPSAAIRAVAEIESGGRLGFDAQRRPKILFEAATSPLPPSSTPDAPGGSPREQDVARVVADHGGLAEEGGCWSGRRSDPRAEGEALGERLEFGEKSPRAPQACSTALSISRTSPRRPGKNAATASSAGRVTTSTGCSSAASTSDT